MKIANRKLVTCMMAFTLALGSLSISTSASAGKTYDFNSKPGGGNILLDTILLRPISLASSVVGTAVFVVTLPFSALGGNVGDSAETLILEPLEYTFLRPLGEI